MLLLGAHTSTQGGPAAAVRLAEKLGFTAMQIFTKNNNRWFQRPLSDSEISEYLGELSRSNIRFVLSHAAYLINLCAVGKEVLEKSREALIDELFRCEQLNIPHCNFHPGSHGGNGEDYGINLIAESLNIIHDKTPGFKVKSMLELTAGQGTSLGHTFEQIRSIIDRVEDKSRISVCIDTAHIWAAGYDIKSEKGFRQTIKNFDAIVGLDKLKCIHMNDSKKDIGTRVDRHDHIGKGFIGVEGFRNIMNSSKLKMIPKVLETPKGKEQLEDLENIKVLKRLIKK
ncbi:MAG: deoxyribonuclease IV [Ignavibacteriaceae bacterium]|nr:deoxyribonuclease IV [Ignavibacteriaceae bacterium]